MLIQTNFIAGKMNKSVDERLVPLGEYVDALNVRLGSTEGTEVGAVENSKGNTVLTNLQYQNQSLSASARCLGAFEDGIKETIYWFVHDSSNISSASGEVSLIVSYNVNVGTLTYHVISETVLNFNPLYLITGVNKIGDLLFFTDDFNPPRYINVRRNYNNDTTLTNPLREEDISVIVKPPGFEESSGTSPLGQPFLELFDNGTTEDYMENRFLCFAYRYRYNDGGYSATSLFTPPAFEPKPFNFSTETFSNEGMVNRYNSARVYFSTGPARVTEVQVLYKEAGSNNIYIIDRLNKSTQGLPDDSYSHITFTNSKILSVLGSDELLRLYDNVPRLAQAQTIQGNRLMYGNYVDQYDIAKDPGGSPIEIRYQVAPKSTSTGGVAFPLPQGAPGVYNIDPSNAGKTITNSIVRFDLTDTPLPILAGTSFQFSFSIQNVDTDNNLGSDVITELQSSVNVIMTFFANQAYPTVDSMLSSQEFQDSVGTLTTITPLLPYTTPPPPLYPPTTPFPPNAGSTVTDLFNSAIPYAWTSVSSTNPLLLINSSIDGACTGLPLSPWPPTTDVCQSAQEPMLLKHFGDANPFPIPSNSFLLQLPAVLYYFDNGDAADPNRYTEQFQYYAFDLANTFASSTRVGFTGSLHSYRDYEVGVVYMDDYARASTVLTTATNTVFFPAGSSTQKNQAAVTLENSPPYWAKHYKFVMKPSQGAYETLWSTLSFQQSGCPNPDECGPEPFSIDLASYWFRLEGQSQNLVSVGDILTVKRDLTGPIGSFITAEVLDKEALYSGQIQGTNPAGVYIRLKPSGWVADLDPTLDENINETDTAIGPYAWTDGSADGDIFTGSTTALAVEGGIAAGSTIRIIAHAYRGGNDNEGGGLFGCDTKNINFDSGDMLVLNDAANLHAALMGLDFVNRVTESLSTNVDGMEISFDPELFPNSDSQPVMDLFHLYFYVTIFDTNPNKFVLRTRSNIPWCTQFSNTIGDQTPTNKLTLIVNYSGGEFCFETETAEVDPNLFYDASDLLDIDSQGFHQAKRVWNPITQTSSLAPGSVDQTATVPLQTTLDFYNCYMFGNGVESFRIEDKIGSKSFGLGQRVLAVSNQDFKEADRFSGMTYSGVYSDSANSNNLNEFNLGLVNYKDLETDFGPIMKMHSRETDILILQEDRISYVLSGKNVITDSTGGGAIASVPEILGTQIARIEEYGISFNPESFASWGSAMFFTDTKRGVVLMLRGASAGSDQLKVISSEGMRSWFRDQFNDQLTTQKIGGYDPYMDEYVLSTNRLTIPLPLETLPCGQELAQAETSEEISFILELGQLIGEVNVPYVISAGEITIAVDWNGTVFTSGPVSTSGSFSFDKTSASPDFATVTLTPTIGQAATYGVTFECVEEIALTVIQVVVNSNDYSGESIHTEYTWDDGTTFSPTIQNAITLDATLPTSSYISQTGVRSTGGFPYDGASVTLKTRKIIPDTFNFDPTSHSFKILSSSVLYEDNNADIDALVIAASTVLPINNPSTPVYTAEEVGTIQGGAFPIPDGNQYLYLIWDLRAIRASQLCYSNSKLEIACCDCTFTCGTCWFSPVQQSSKQVCASNTDAFGSAQWSFNSIGSIPMVGDTVFLDSLSTCEPTDGAVSIASGYYIVDPNQPSSASPLNWVRIGTNGLVIDSGTC